MPKVKSYGLAARRRKATLREQAEVERNIRNTAAETTNPIAAALAAALDRRA